MASVALCTGGVSASQVALDPFLQMSQGTIGNPGGGGAAASCYFGFTNTTTFGINAFAFSGFAWKVWDAAGSVIGSGSLSGDSGFTNHASLLTGLSTGTHYVAKITLTNSLLASLLGDTGVALTNDVFGNTLAISGVPNFATQTWAANAAHPSAGYTFTVSQDGLNTLPAAVQLNGLQAVGNGGSFTNVASSGFIGFAGGGSYGTGNYLSTLGAQLMEYEINAKSDQLWAYVYSTHSSWATFIDGVRQHHVQGDQSETFQWVQIGGFGSDGYDNTTHHTVRLRLGTDPNYGFSVVAFMLTNNDGSSGTLGEVSARPVVVAAGDSITFAALLNPVGPTEDGTLGYVSQIMDHYGWAGTCIAVSATHMPASYVIPSDSVGYSAFIPQPYNWGSGANSGETLCGTLASFCHTHSCYFDYFIGSWATNDLFAFGGASACRCVPNRDGARHCQSVDGNGRRRRPGAYDPSGVSGTLGPTLQSGRTERCIHRQHTGFPGDRLLSGHRCGDHLFWQQQTGGMEPTGGAS